MNFLFKLLLSLSILLILSLLLGVVAVVVVLVVVVIVVVVVVAAVVAAAAAAAVVVVKLCLSAIEKNTVMCSVLKTVFTTSWYKIYPSKYFFVI